MPQFVSSQEVDNVKFCDDYPLTVTGKVQEFRMREIAVEELGLQAAAAVRTA